MSTARRLRHGEGTVSEAAIRESSISAEFGACLAGAVQRWRFPKPQGGGAVKVAYPFVLETGADDESRSGFQVTPGAFR